MELKISWGCCTDCCPLFRWSIYCGCTFRSSWYLYWCRNSFQLHFWFWNSWRMGCEYLTKWHWIHSFTRKSQSKYIYFVKCLIYLYINNSSRNWNRARNFMNLIFRLSDQQKIQSLERVAYNCTSKCDPLWGRFNLLNHSWHIYSKMCYFLDPDRHAKGFIKYFSNMPR